MINRQTLKEFAALLVGQPVDPRQQAARIAFMEENVLLPVKAVIWGIIAYFIFFSDWFEGERFNGTVPMSEVRFVFLGYLALHIGEALLLRNLARVSMTFIQWVVAVVNLTDALIIASLALLTGGLTTIVYWVFLGLIVRNAVSVPVPSMQITLNILVIGCYGYAAILDKNFIDYEIVRQFGLDEPNVVTRGVIGPVTSFQPYVIRVCLMVLLLICCYGVQILFDKQRQAEDDMREFFFRQEQLQSAGRLAAEIAHQIKNPLAIISNVAFSMQRAGPDSKANFAQQLQIIRDEVGRADRIITELMGYAQLAEGRVEKLDVIAELNDAIAEVFPPKAKYKVTIRRHYQNQRLPALHMQKGHLKEIFVNLLSNAREAMSATGNLDVSVASSPDYIVNITIKDDGPGIPADKLTKIFEAYFTTKETGTGLGLAIVKHNIDIYGGTIRVESELGKGAAFIIHLPVKTMMRLRK